MINLELTETEKECMAQILRAHTSCAEMIVETLINEGICNDEPKEMRENMIIAASIQRKFLAALEEESRQQGGQNEA